MKTYLLKIGHRVSDQVFKICSSFFEGRSSGASVVSIEGNSDHNQVFTWQLNQGIEDIALKDFQAMAAVMVPGIVIRKLQKAHRWYSIFCLTDDIYITENNSDTEKNPNTSVHPGTGHRIMVGLSENKVVNRCISFLHAFRFKTRQVKRIIPERISRFLAKARLVSRFVFSVGTCPLFFSASSPVRKLAPMKFFHKRN